MGLLEISPLLSAILGFLLSLFIVSRTSGLGSDKRIRFVLSALILVYAYTSLDYYLSLKLDISSLYSGGSYLFYHLIGPLFYYFIALFTKTPVSLKKWLPGLLGYTLLRWGLFLTLLPYDTVDDIIASGDDFGTWFWVELEYLIATGLNIFALVKSYMRLKHTPPLLELTKTEQLHYRWTKVLVLLFIVFQVASAINTIINTNQSAAFETYIYIESWLLTAFFLVLAYSFMHLPVFAFSGSFNDLPETVKKKYAHSSLADSAELFQRIDACMKEEQLYLDYNFKLNTLADKLDQSVHHISQAINENADMGFSDYVNQFRIEAAKQKILAPNPDTIYAISLDVGFGSKAVFYTAFKKNVQMTPTEFKKQHNPSS